MAASSIPWKKIVILAVFGIAIALFFVFDGQQYVSIPRFKAWVGERPVEAAAAFFTLYVVVAAGSLPVAVPLTMIGGAVFGFWQGLLLVSFASTIGGSLAFIVARTVLADWVQAKFANYLVAINEGVEKEGIMYLLTARLMPIIPFFVINLVMGLTRIKLWTFYWVSQIGMIAGTAIYVNAGSKLGEVTEFSVKGIFTPAITASFVLLAVFPYIVKYGVRLLKKNKEVEAQ